MTGPKTGPMTDVITESSAARPSAAAGTDRGRRRWRWPLAAGALLLATGVLAALLLPRGSQAALDPSSAAPEGSRAVAQILARQGVVVSRVTRGAELAGKAAPGTTVLVTGLELLAPERLQQLDDTGADLVLVAPDAVSLRVLAPAIRPAGVVDPAVRGPGSDCRSADALAAGPALAGGQLYAVRPDPGAVATRTIRCYPDPNDPTAGSLVGQTGSGRSVTVIGQPEILTNDRLAEQGNAALAVRTLGRNRSLVWYLPDPLDTGGATAASLADLRPRWVTWVAWQLVIAAAMAMLWRGRRLGGLVTEPLPVVVRAAETPQGRARLYRASRARGRAAATLRTASIRRLARRIDAPTEATPAGVVRLVAAAAGRPEADVSGLLLGPVPEHDAALVWLADQLDALEAAMVDPTTTASTSSPKPTRKGPRP
jgi:Domain of unknown function (DUF4350)